MDAAQRNPGAVAPVLWFQLRCIQTIIDLPCPHSLVTLYVTYIDFGYLNAYKNPPALLVALATVVLVGTLA
jgi:hypothetical protein